MGTKNRKIFKSICVMLCALLLVGTMSISIYAAVYNTTIGTSYYSMPVKPSQNGHYFFIKVQNSVIFAYNDVRMLDNYGNVVWEEHRAINGNSSRTFWCGSNIARIEVKTNTGFGVISAYDCD